ncbi:hypothetical protein ACFQ1I_04785 [Kitasatospora arboriphila]
MKLDVVLAGDHVRLPGPVPGAASGGERIVPAAAVRDADPEADPPEIRTVLGETLFVPAGAGRTGIVLHRQRDSPAVQARRVGRPPRTVPRHRVPPGRRAATRARLRRVGLGDEEVAAIRARAAPLMRAYNAVHQDWHHLGLADLLDAATAAWIPGHRPVGSTDADAFRTWAMEIADLGFPGPGH